MCVIISCRWNIFTENLLNKFLGRYCKKFFDNKHFQVIAYIVTFLLLKCCKKILYKLFSFVIARHFHSYWSRWFSKFLRLTSHIGNSEPFCGLRELSWVFNFVDDAFLENLKICFEHFFTGFVSNLNFCWNWFLKFL